MYKTSVIIFLLLLVAVMSYPTEMASEVAGGNTVGWTTAPELYREFESVTELKAWLRQDKGNEMEYIYKRYDCDDYAIALCVAGMEDGYLIGLKGSMRHLMNFTIIGNKAYKIEPQNDEVTFWTRVD